MNRLFHAIIVREFQLSHVFSEIASKRYQLRYFREANNDNFIVVYEGTHPITIVASETIELKDEQ